MNKAEKFGKIRILALLESKLCKQYEEELKEPDTKIVLELEYGKCTVKKVVKDEIISKKEHNYTTWLYGEE